MVVVVAIRTNWVTCWSSIRKKAVCLFELVAFFSSTSKSTPKKCSSIRVDNFVRIRDLKIVKISDIVLKKSIKMIQITLGNGEMGSFFKRGPIQSKFQNRNERNTKMNGRQSRKWRKIDSILAAKVEIVPDSKTDFHKLPNQKRLQIKFQHSF